MAFIIVLVAMLVLMYLLLIRPQRAQQRRTQEMLSALKPGDEVITIGGIYGDVVEVDDEKVVLEIAEDVHIEVTRRAIANIVPPETEEAPDEPEELEAAESDEPDEHETAAETDEDARAEAEPERDAGEPATTRQGRFGFGRRSE